MSLDKVRATLTSKKIHLLQCWGFNCLLLPETSDVYLERKLAKPQHHGILKSTYIVRRALETFILAKD